MEFRLLGPVEADSDGRPVNLGSRKQRLLLAMLLMSPNQPISSTRLAEMIWPSGTPVSVRTVIHGLVYRLRRALAAAGAARWQVSVSTLGSGYLINTDPTRVDAHRFQTALAQAGRTDTDQRKVELLRAGLELWRGPALANAADDDVRARLCASLNEARLVAIEDLMDAELRLGRHHGLVFELTDLVDGNPGRERLAGQLMLALYRSGQTSRACDVYANTRRLLAKEYGVDPGPALRRLHTAMLRGDSTLDVPAPVGKGADWPVPAQLPVGASAFTGRERQLAALDALLVTTVEDATSAPVCVITGTAGVGKTELAVHWARARRDRFPGGQIFVNLGGHDSSGPLTAAAGLAQALSGLAVPASRLPSGTSERSALYRSLLAGKRVLVVLDDAVGANQVRPLLPGGGVVLVTSRYRLGGLVAREGAHQVDVDAFTPAEARELVRRLVGRRDAEFDDASLTVLAGLCAYLPLALRVAATNLAERPDLDVAEYLRRLRGDGRLTMLAVAGDDTTSVRVALRSSYRRLDPAARRLFRLLGHLPAPRVTARSAAALAGADLPTAQSLLNRLAAANLITGSSDEYGFHELLHLYARELSRRADDRGRPTPKQ